MWAVKLVMPAANRMFRSPSTQPACAIALAMKVWQSAQVRSYIGDDTRNAKIEMPRRTLTRLNRVAMSLEVPLLHPFLLLTRSIRLTLSADESRQNELARLAKGISSGGDVP